MYASRGGGGSTLMHPNAYKGGGGGGLKMTKNKHFVRRFLENATKFNIECSIL